MNIDDDHKIVEGLDFMDFDNELMDSASLDPEYYGDECINY